MNQSFLVTFVLIQTSLTMGKIHILSDGNIPLWDIPDEAKSIAMPLFYKYLMEGMTSQEAIVLVRRDMINKGDSDPYYWASFVILN